MAFCVIPGICVYLLYNVCLCLWGYMEEKKFGKDLTVGSVPKHLLSFSIPMLLANMLQSGYSIINMIWVGNIVGENGLGATAVSFPVMFILIGLAAGLTMATSVLVAQFYGAKNYERLRSVVNTSFTICFILSIILTSLLIGMSDFLLRLMDTPPEIFSLSSTYLKISLGGVILLYFMFTITSILRGIGDTVTPLFFMGIAVIINAILDPFMIIGLCGLPRMGLNGAAWASIISQAIALILGIIYLNRKNHLLSFNFRSLAINRHIAWLIFKIGFPSMIQQSLISIGQVFVTTYVNYFGASAIAAFGAATRIDMVATMPSLAIGMAATALTGQNLGARKPERVKEIFKWAVLMGMIISGFLSILAISFPRLILSMFIHHEPVLDIGIQYLRIVAPCYFLFALLFVSSGVVNGAGQTIVTMIFSLVSLYAVRVPLAAYLSRHTSLAVKGVWVAMAAGFVVTAGVNYLYYLSGRWQKTASRILAPKEEPQVV
jgi:putative MATE family efflux protein